MISVLPRLAPVIKIVFEVIVTGKDIWLYANMYVNKLYLNNWDRVRYDTELCVGLYIHVLLTPLRPKSRRATSYITLELSLSLNRRDFIGLDGRASAISSDYCFW